MATFNPCLPAGRTQPRLQMRSSVIPFFVCYFQSGALEGSEGALDRSWFYWQSNAQLRITTLT
jgi:hypothetical protein